MPYTRVRRRLAAVQALLTLAILIARCALALAADEAHQLVRSYQATFPKDGAELRITLRPANAAEVHAFYDAEPTPRIVKILELGMRRGASLLKGKEVAWISVEYGRP